jgi:hypothetical protein
MEDANEAAHQRCDQSVLAELIAVGCAPDNSRYLHVVGPTLV